MHIDDVGGDALFPEVLSDATVTARLVALVNIVFAILVVIDIAVRGRFVEGEVNLSLAIL